MSALNCIYVHAFWNRFHGPDALLNYNNSNNNLVRQAYLSSAVNLAILLLNLATFQTTLTAFSSKST